jgi:hypothetical protein
MFRIGDNVLRRWEMICEGISIPFLLPTYYPVRSEKNTVPEKEGTLPTGERFVYN